MNRFLVFFGVLLVCMQLGGVNVISEVIQLGEAGLILALTKYLELFLTPVTPEQILELQEKAIQKAKHTECTNPPAYRYHVVVTTSNWGGWCAYQEWQVLVLHERIKELQLNPCSAIGGFTRLLVGQPDAFMDQVPTMLIPENNGEKDTPGYLVGPRAKSLLMFGEESLPDLEEDYVLVLEPDMFFMKEWPPLATPTKPLLARYDYMQQPGHNIMSGLKLHTNYTGDTYPPLVASGPSPGLFHKDQFVPLMKAFNSKVYDLWREDEDLKEKGKNEYWGWLRDMHAFVIATYNMGMEPIVRDDLMLVPDGCYSDRDQPHVHPYLKEIPCPTGLGKGYGQATFSDAKPEANVSIMHFSQMVQITNNSQNWLFNKRVYGEHWPEPWKEPPVESFDALHQFIVGLNRNLLRTHNYIDGKFTVGPPRKCGDKQFIEDVFIKYDEEWVHYSHDEL